MDQLTDNQRDVFARGMEVLDAHYKPPLLWASAKLSSWYAVGLLARDGNGDRERACILLQNSFLMQDLDEDLPQDYGTFKANASLPFPSGKAPLWPPKCYDSYDPNNGLFFTMAGILIMSLFRDKLPPDVIEGLSRAMIEACRGQRRRQPDDFGDNMRPAYTNVWMLRCACCAFVGHMTNDQELKALAEDWTREAVEMYDLFDTPGEFNSATYAGVTIMALCLGQYCPTESLLHKEAPRLLRSVWQSLGEAYNPSLSNLAGAWDRTYGYCMTQYYATLGSNIAAVTGVKGNYPMPKPLMTAEHLNDVAIIPMQMITGRYAEAGLDDGLRAKFHRLYEPHMYTPKSFFPPYDKSARRYTFWLEDGLSAGGIEFDESVIGGPAKNLEQFCPGVIQWDSGNHGAGCGWLSIWPETACASIVALPKSLAIRLPRSVDFPNSPRANQITIRLGCLPCMQLDKNTFAKHKASLPGIDLTLRGNVVDQGVQTFEFKVSNKLHGASYYELRYSFSDDLVKHAVPEFIIDFRKTMPPVYSFAGL